MASALALLELTRTLMGYSPAAAPVVGFTSTATLVLCLLLMRRLDINLVSYAGLKLISQPWGPVAARSKMASSSNLLSTSRENSKVASDGPRITG